MRARHSLQARTGPVATRPSRCAPHGVRFSIAGGVRLSVAIDSRSTAG